MQIDTARAVSARSASIFFLLAAQASSEAASKKGGAAKLRRHHVLVLNVQRPRRPFQGQSRIRRSKAGAEPEKAKEGWQSQRKTLDNAKTGPKPETKLRHVSSAGSNCCICAYVENRPLASRARSVPTGRNCREICNRSAAQ